MKTIFGFCLLFLLYAAMLSLNKHNILKECPQPPPPSEPAAADPCMMWVPFMGGVYPMNLCETE